MKPFALPSDRPAVMGVLNVTPDSFSDGGAYDSSAAAVEAGLQMVSDGADLIDVGGESTRPGAEEVSVEEEKRRVIPVVEGLCSHGVFVSIDTRKPEVARATLAAGAFLVNDVGGLREPLMVKAVAESGASICIVHMQGTPDTMQKQPVYKDVVGEIRDYLVAQAFLAAAGGIDQSRIWVDPGFGFGKTYEHTLEMFRRLGEFCELGFPALIGISRKSFLGRMGAGQGQDPLPVDQRLEAALALQSFAQLHGVRAIRTHDVRETVRAINALTTLG